MTESQERAEQPLPAVELQRRAVQGSLWTAIHTLGYLPLAFVANALIARSLGVTSYGHLAFLTAMLALAMPFANMGFSIAFLQYGSRAEAAGRRREADELLERSLGFHLAYELPVLVLIAGVLTWGDPVWEVAALGAVVLFSCLFSGGALSMTIENRSAGAAKLAIGVNLAVQAAAVAMAIVTHSASAVWAARALVPALALVLNFCFLDRARRRKALTPRLPRRLGARFWRFALLSWAAGLLALLVFSRSEILLLNLLHRPAALGLFAVAFGLSQQVTAPADALLGPLLPAVAGVFSSWPERARAAFDRSTRLSALICGGIAAVAVPTVVFLVPLLYGASFAGASWLFVPLALVSMIQSVNNPVTAFVSARERGGLRLKVTAVALVVDVAVALALIPPFGAWGAVVANIAGQIVVLAWLAFTEPLVMERPTIVLSLYRPFFLGVGAAAVALLVGAAAEQLSPIGPPAIACVAGMITYAIALRLARSGLTQGDLEALVGSVSPRARIGVARVLYPITARSADR